MSLLPLRLRQDTHLRAEIKKLRLLFYGAQNEIATLTHSLEAVLRELQDLKQRQETSNG